MAIDKNRMKTSLFLAFLMILTPFATASTVTTFSDGSSEVEIKFKDGFPLLNNTDGGFYVGSGETITSAEVNISSSPLKHHTMNRFSGIRSINWDSNLNNGATYFDNVSKFEFNKNTVQNSVQLTSESFISDFELDNGDFDNGSDNSDLSGEESFWDYNAILNRELNQGPDNCASGDMCWGTNIFDEDYRDDSSDTGLAYQDSYIGRLTTPTIYLDNNLNDTFLRFSSWHQLETKYNSQGDYYYDDCAFLEIEYSAVGQFNGEETIETLMINVPQTTGISPAYGLHAKDSVTTSRDRISPECTPISNNQFGLAGTSINSQNPDGWATVAANLAPYLGNYVRIKFNLFHADAPGNAAAFPTPGWYIDDVTIGERYFSDGTMIIQDIISPQMLIKNPRMDMVCCS